MIREFASREDEFILVLQYMNLAILVHLCVPEVADIPYCEGYIICAWPLLMNGSTKPPFAASKTT